MTTTASARRVIVPVDFGDASARAIAIGGAIARQWPARLQLVHAEPFEAPAYFTHDQLEALAADARERRRQAGEYLRTFGRLHTTAPFDVAIDSEPPTPAILSAAAGADLVVMGTHGRRGPSRWWLGSVAERVLRDIAGPLLVVHAADRPEGLFDRVLVTSEPPLAGTAAIALATALAAPAGGHLIDRRHQPVTTDDETGASLVVVAVPPVHAPAGRLRFGLTRVRRESGPVLFVPEEKAP